MKHLLPFLLLLMLSACGMGNWFKGPEEAKLPGDRIAVLTRESAVEADPELSGLNVTLPAPSENAEWRQDGGNAQSVVENSAYSGNFIATGRVDMGDGDGWDEGLMPAPVVAEGHVFAIDSAGYVSAYSNNLHAMRWRYEGLVEEDETRVVGGGVGYDNQVLYAASGRGMVAAINAADGKEIWKIALKLPLRSAPRMVAGTLYLLTVDNQIFALDKDTGGLRWSQRGINETASYLSLVTPAADENFVVVPLSTGEIKVLKSANGDDVWSDSWVLPKRTSAASSFSSIEGNPLIAHGVVFAVSSNGLMAANLLATGQRLWELPLSSTNPPALAGDFLYTLTTNAELVCMTARNGRVKWVKQLPRFKDEKSKKDAYQWVGPVVAGGKILVIGAHGALLSIAPETGEVTSTHSVPKGVTVLPIIAGGMLYMLAQDATLYAYK